MRQPLRYSESSTIQEFDLFLTSRTCGACIKVLSLHHDISTVTGEEVVLFTLIQAPQVREVKKKPNS